MPKMRDYPYVISSIYLYSSFRSEDMLKILTCRVYIIIFVLTRRWRGGGVLIEYIGYALVFSYSYQTHPITEGA